MERSFEISKTSFSIHRNVLNGSPVGLSSVERHQQKAEAKAENDCFHFRFFFYLLLFISENYSSAVFLDSHLKLLWRILCNVFIFHSLLLEKCRHSFDEEVVFVSDKCFVFFKGIALVSY